MDSISKKINNDTIKLMNKFYKELYTLQCKRSYILKENKYDDNIEKCIGELFKSLDAMYLSIIEKETVEEMEGDMVDKMEVYDDSGIPDIQGTFDECITPRTPRTPRTVQEPSTPTAPVKARKKIIVEEHDLEDNDVEDNDVEEDNVLNHIMNYSDEESGNDSENSYEKISDEEEDYSRDVELMSLEDYRKKYPDAHITSLHNGNYKMTHYNGETKELCSSVWGDHDMGITDIYAAYPYPIN